MRVVDVVRFDPVRRPAGPIVSTRNPLVREFAGLHDARVQASHAAAGQIVDLEPDLGCVREFET